ncbi:MAG: START domain-containing protein [Spirochaetes bacterium]|nr:START domain-containing protein [Spirochaetota bacterium]
MKRYSIILIFVGLVALCVAVFAQNNPWKLIYEGEEDKATVKIYTRDIPGSPYKEFKGVSYSDIPFDVALKVIQDYNNYHKWYGMCDALYAISVRNPKDIDMYFVLDLPVVTDRDVVVKVESGWDQAKGVAWVNMTSVNDSEYKKDSGLVRMTSLKGRWDIIKKDENHVEVIYQVHAELGGSLPAWVVNIAAKDQPLKTLKGVYKYSKKIRDQK